MPLENAKGVYEGQRKEDPDKRVFILTRSAYAGLQRYAAATWSGDIGARWNDMKNQISAGINFSMSGLPYWTMDIGGFAVEKRYEHAKGEDLDEWRELMTRWYQFGAFCPLFRSHGQFPYREIFNVAPEDHPAYKSMLYYDRLRYRLMPYIYSLAGETYFDNYTIMRALVMDFATDTTVRNIGDQYMFGPSLLVNPVYDYKARSRDLYLPAGSGWYDAYTGKYFTGGQHIKAAAPYERMPLLCERRRHPAHGACHTIYRRKACRSCYPVGVWRQQRVLYLYEDEGTNYNYEKGQYATIPFTYNDKTKTITIGQRKGSFNGMLQERTFRVILVNKNHPQVMDPDLPAGKTIQYTGDSISVTLP